MAKRSRDDFDPPSEELNSLAQNTAVTVAHFTTETPTSKILQLDPDENSGEGQSTTEMKCSLPPHRETLSFPSLESFEIHYKKVHQNRCVECRKNFPTEYFLNLHIEENHDALVSVRKERGERTYACYVEDCDRMCSTAFKRQLHLIDKHLFPKDYDFNIVNSGIDNRSSMLKFGRHRRRSSAAYHKTQIDERANRRSSALETASSTDDKDKNSEGATEKAKTEANAGSSSSSPDVAMEGLTCAMSSLKFVPPSVRFGRGRGKARGGFSRT